MIRGGPLLVRDICIVTKTGSIFSMSTVYYLVPNPLILERSSISM